MKISFFFSIIFILKLFFFFFFLREKNKEKSLLINKAHFFKGSNPSLHNEMKNLKKKTSSSFLKI